MFWSRRGADITPETLHDELEAVVARHSAQLRSAIEAQLRAEFSRELDARLAALEQRHADELSALRQALLAEVGTDPQARQRVLLAGLSDELAQRTRAALAASDGAAQAIAALAAACRDATAAGAAIAPFAVGGEQRPAPERVPLATVRQASSLGLVFAWFDGGGTDIAELRVGPQAPPQTVVGRINARNRLNSAIAGLVRPGEWWTVTSEVGAEDSGVAVIYTALT